MNEVPVPDRHMMFPRTGGLRMIAACAAPMLVLPAFAQSSAPVTSSVFVHPATEDTGGQSAAINDNWKFITNPPAHPVAASEPASSSDSHHGRHGRGGGGAGGGGGHMGGMGSMGNTDDTVAAPAGSPSNSPANSSFNSPAGSSTNPPAVPAGTGQ